MDDHHQNNNPMATNMATSPLPPLSTPTELQAEVCFSFCFINDIFTINYIYRNYTTIKPPQRHPMTTTTTTTTHRMTHRHDTSKDTQPRHIKQHTERRPMANATEQWRVRRGWGVRGGAMATGGLRHDMSRTLGLFFLYFVLFYCINDHLTTARLCVCQCQCQHPAPVDTTKPQTKKKGPNDGLYRHLGHMYLSFFLMFSLILLTFICFSGTQ